MNKTINTNAKSVKSAKTVNFVNIAITAAAILTAVVLVALMFTGCFFLFTKLIIPAVKTILFATINILLSFVIPVYLLTRTRKFKKATMHTSRSLLTSKRKTKTRSSNSHPGNSFKYHIIFHFKLLSHICSSLKQGRAFSFCRLAYLCELNRIENVT